jgi:glutathione S-transferase
MTAGMPTLLLHQYDVSPFSEKIRKLLALKRVPWGAVTQPTIMPKPDLVPLTGGYRRIPVLQIGADVYCDTQLIARTLERLHPTPTMYPGGSEATCHAWNLWADRLLFLPVVAVVFAEIGSTVPHSFIEDRTKMMPGRDFADIPKQAPHAREQIRALITVLETALADRRPFLLGQDLSFADAACWHPLWFLRLAPGAQALVEPLPHLRAWMERMDALGDGERTSVTPAEALAIACESRPAAVAAADPHEPNGLAPGAHVSVTPDDYAFDPVEGELVFSTVHEVAIRRRDAAVGEVVVHFPRYGFRVATVRSPAPRGT